MDQPTKTDVSQHIEAADDKFPADRELTAEEFDEKNHEAYMSTADLYPNINESKLLHKMDRHILPTLSILYLLSFLDRGNIGNANIEGLSEDLHLHGNQYNLCLTIFFITYSLFEVPSNMMLKILRPSIWLPTIMVAWGIVMTLMGIVQGFQGLFACRLFLGVAEAGLFPGVSFYLTNWYCRKEIQFRSAMFFGAASVAGAFSGLLAFGIAKMDGVGNLAGWRWIFILEGILTVFVAIIAYFLLYDYPDTASFLTEEERGYVIHRLKYDTNFEQVTGAFRVEEAGHVSWKYVRDAFLDWQIYLHLLVYYGIVCPLYGVSLFLPTILKNLGYTSSKAQLMTVPIYITACILSVCQGILADKVGKRSPFILFNMICMIIGYTMAISSDPRVHPGVIYAGVYIVAAGLYPAFPGIVSWMANNLAGQYKRAVGMAIQIGVGNLGGAMASNFYRSKDAPRFILGHALELGFIGVGIISLITLDILYTLTNKKREKDLLAGKYDHLTPLELSAMGDKNPHFRYRI